MSELPQGWAHAQIEDISIKGQQRKPENDHEIIYVDIASIDRKLKKICTPQLLKGSEAPSRARKIINEGDVLVSLTRPNLNAVAHVSPAYNGQFASTGFEVIKTTGIESRYVFLLTRTKKFIDDISGATQGALYPAAKSSDIRSYEIPLAPLNEQIRIANKLDSLLAKVDAAQAHLEQIPTLLKRFRQSVLAAATSGELTREWRDNQDANWQLTLLKNVASGFNYGSSAKSKPEGDVPVLRMGNLQGGNIDWGNLVFTSDEVEIEKYILEPGDVLFNRTNSPELVGKTSIYRGEQKAIYAGYLIRIRGTELLDSEYLNIQLNSPHARDYCWQVKTDGVSQSNINAKKIQAYQFELPSIKEQKEIVRRVESLFTLADVVEKQYLEAKQRVDRLTQSLLAKAFRGELVPQDPNDEPASELLKRIQAEREALAAIKPVRKTRRKPVQKSHS